MKVLELLEIAKKNKRADEKGVGPIGSALFAIHIQLLWEWKKSNAAKNFGERLLKSMRDAV